MFQRLWMSRLRTRWSRNLLKIQLTKDSPPPSLLYPIPQGHCPINTRLVTKWRAASVTSSNLNIRMGSLCQNLTRLESAITMTLLILWKMTSLNALNSLILKLNALTFSTLNFTKANSNILKVKEPRVRPSKMSLWVKFTYMMTRPRSFQQSPSKLKELRLYLCRAKVVPTALALTT
jgi:hypothetical protein